jgi:hypothetical protein
MNDTETMRDLMTTLKTKYSSDDHDNCVAEINWDFIERDIKESFALAAISKTFETI